MTCYRMSCLELRRNPQLSAKAIVPVSRALSFEHRRNTYIVVVADHILGRLDAGVVPLK
jgi:hypothetical protein